MDPNATLRELVDELEAGWVTEEAREHAEALRNWLRHKGFTPAVDARSLYALLDVVLYCPNQTPA